MLRLGRAPELTDPTVMMIGSCEAEANCSASMVHTTGQDSTKVGDHERIPDGLRIPIPVGTCLLVFLDSFGMVSAPVPPVAISGQLHRV